MLGSVRLKSFLEIGALGVALVFTQTGCPGGADLEQPDSYAGRFSTGGTGSGGTGAGGTAPIAGTGTGATAGSGTAGSGTAGTGSGGFDITTFTCTGADPVAIFKKCASIGCHNTASMQSGLVLTPDVNLGMRVKDVPAKHGGIDCAADGQPFMECTTPPAGCPSGALLVNSADWQSSWIVGKVRGANNGTCGLEMPYTYTLATQDEACVEAVVQAIANSH
jgi:hypothetical protein